MFFSLAAAGCGLGQLFGGTPKPIRVRIEAASRLNPDEHGESLPTALRVYQLANLSRAPGVELLALLQDPKEALGDTLLAVDELLVAPGGRAERSVAREKGTRAVLVVAVFRRPAGQAWRYVAELPRSVSDLSFDVEEYRLARR